MLKLLSTIYLLLICFVSFSQFTLRGKVINDKNEKLEYAVIFIDGTKLSTITDHSGNYEIQSIPQGKYLVSCSYLGYVTLKMEIEINSDISFDFILEGSIYNLDEIEIKSNRYNFTSSPSSTDIKSDDLKNENLGQDVPMLLQMQASVVSTSDAGAGVGYTGMRIRGTDQSRINVTINDVPVNDAESQGVFWVDLPDIASSTENIRIQRGVGPSTNGAGAYGGTVALSTFGTAINPFIQINSSFGSFNTKKLGVVLNSGLMNNQFNVEARYSVINSDGYVDRGSADLSSWYIEGSKINSKSSLRILTFSGKEVTYQSWNGAPQALIDGDKEKLLQHYNNNQGTLYNNQSDSFNLFNSDRTYNYYRYKNQVDDYSQTHLQVHYSNLISKKLKGKLSLHYTRGKGFFEQYRYLDALSSYGLPGFEFENETYDEVSLVRRRWLDNHFYGAVYKFEYSVNKDNLLSVGGAANWYDGSHFGQIVGVELLDTIRRYSGQYYDNVGAKSDANIYLRYESNWSNKWTTAIDLQYRNVGYKIDGIDNDRRVLNASNSYNFFNPKLTLNYKLNNNSVLLSSFGIANREPDRSDFVDNLLTTIPKSETLYDTELSYQLTKSNFKFESTVYWMNYKNQLVITGALNDVGNPLRVNTPDSYRLGLELISSFKISSKFDWAINTTLSRNKIKTFNEILYDYTNGSDQKIIEHENTDISFSPNVVIGNLFSFKPVKQLSIGLQTKFISKQFLDNTSNDSKKLDAYNFSNLRFSFAPTLKFAKSSEFYLQLNNIFNQLYSSNGYTYSYIYEDLITENFLYPQAGFHFMLGLSLKL